MWQTHAWSVFCNVGLQADTTDMSTGPIQHAGRAIQKKKRVVILTVLSKHRMQPVCSFKLPKPKIPLPDACATDAAVPFT